MIDITYAILRLTDHPLISSLNSKSGRTYFNSFGIYAVMRIRIIFGLFCRQICQHHRYRDTLIYLFQSQQAFKHNAVKIAMISNVKCINTT